jgi:uncharacterized membrane protein
MARKQKRASAHKRKFAKVAKKCAKLAKKEGIKFQECMKLFFQELFLYFPLILLFCFIASLVSLTPSIARTMSIATSITTTKPSISEIRPTAAFT